MIPTAERALGPSKTGRVPAWLSWVCLAGLALAVSGCSLLRTGAHPGEPLQSLVGGGKKASDPTPVAVLQSEVMREADRYAATVAQATEAFSATAEGADVRATALHWKLDQATAAYINATGPHPALNAVDMVVLATMSRMVVADYWVGRRFGAAAQPLLDAHRLLETNAWSLVAGVLPTEQQQELRGLIAQWRERNPDQRDVPAVRFREFVEELGRSAEPTRAQPGSVFDLFRVDPLAGLDPAVRTLEQTRYLAERAGYYFERAPRLLSWQAELLAYRLAGQPEARQVLADADRFTRSTESFARTAEQLPQLVREEREAAIRQLLAGVAAERSNIVASLDAQETKLRALLPEVRQTLTAGSDMAASVNDAVKSLDAFVRYVSPPDTNTVASPADTNSPPFNVLDYGKSASQIGAMATQLNTLLTSVNQSVPQLAKLSQQSATDLERVVDRAFRLGLVLVGTLLVGAVLAGLTYRVLADRLRRDGPPPPGSSR